MILMPIVYVTDMDRAIAFYGALGFAADPRTSSAMWTELKAGDGAVLALHHDGAPASAARLRVELALVATAPLEAVSRDLAARGIACGPIMDEAFGRSLIVRDPDGLEIQINQHGD